MTLLLLRHGESEGNAEGRIQGSSDEGLTDLGRRQAEAAGRRLARAGAAALYSSDLRRARDTAAVVAAHTGHEAVAEIPALREYGFGEAEGMRWEAARDRYGLDGRNWGSGRIPGEERMAAFRDRVHAAIEELALRHASDVAVAVTHGGVVGAIVSRLLGLGDDGHASIHSANCGVTELRTGADGRIAIGLLNDVCHLRELGAVPADPWLTSE